MLFEETVALYCENQAKHRYSLWAECSFGMSERVVHIVTPGLWEIKCGLQLDSNFDCFRIFWEKEALLIAIAMAGHPGDKLQLHPADRPC
jgi:hypothetical protein